MNDINFVQLAVGMAVILIPIIAGYAARIWQLNAAAIEKRIQAEIGEKWWNLAETAANTLIHAAEQTSGIDTNEEKKAFVLDQLDELAQAWNIPFSREQLSAIIEGVYKSWHKDSSAWAASIRSTSGNGVAIVAAGEAEE